MLIYADVVVVSFLCCYCCWSRRRRRRRTNSWNTTRSPARRGPVFFAVDIIVIAVAGVVIGRCMSPNGPVTCAIVSVVRIFVTTVIAFSSSLPPTPSTGAGWSSD